MQIGIFAKTFPGTSPSTVLRAVHDGGYDVAQFNLACAGLDPMPENVAPDVLESIAVAASENRVELVALSGTYNMAHPDPGYRADGLRRLKVVLAAAKALAIPLVTLCTGSRNTLDQWAHHPDNHAPEAWTEMAMEMQAALDLAEQAGIDLGIEPEQANIVTSAPEAVRLIHEMGSTRLKIVLDPANLFEQANADQARAIIARAVDVAAGHIALAHAKDRRSDGSFAPAGKGVVDFADFGARLKAAGFNGALVTHGLAAEEAAGVAAFLRSTAQ